MKNVPWIFELTVYFKKKGFLDFHIQHTKWTLNKIEITFNGTFTGLKSMHQWFRIYFVCNPRLKAIEMAS